MGYHREISTHTCRNHDTEKSGSLIITTNRELKEWDKVFIDKTLTSAIVDRLLHHSRIIEIRGESYRHKHRD